MSRRVHLEVRSLTEAQKRRLRAEPHATLRDADTGELMVSATLAYIREAIDQRGYVVVGFHAR
ncbi:MAG: hypothetical protein EOP83_35080 [Verrucomicrobiaceae bacterium]|nr:MAG: hypothetical protein EOP83_35080 [Verrucomicrobiaceae bacterium]